MLLICVRNVVSLYKNVKTTFQEEVNDATVHYVEGGFGSLKGEDFLPRPAISPN
jgi:hypothetical protein